MTFDSSEMKALATRRLGYAIAASLLVHLLALWPNTLPVLSKDTPSSLHATLRAPSRLPPEVAPPTLARAVSPAPTPAPLLSRPDQTKLEQTRPAEVPQAVAIAVAAVPDAASGPEPASGLTANAGSPAAGNSLIAEANSSATMVDGLRGYRLEIATQARRFKRYPAPAMAAGWTGSVDIRVEVGGDGRLLPAAVVRSSGHELLDLAAVAMIDAGARRARRPESLRGMAFAVVLPVVFDLDDDK